MNTYQIEFYKDHESEFIAAVEQGFTCDALCVQWPEFRTFMYKWATQSAIELMNRRYFNGRRPIETLRDLNLAQALVANGVFDLNTAQSNGVSRDDAEAVLRSGTRGFSGEGYWAKGEDRLTTVDDTMLAEITICVHFIRACFTTATSIYRIGSYGMKHEVERFTRIAGDHQYIANVSFIVAAILCGIKTDIQVGGRNAVFRMKPISTRHLRIITGAI